MKHQKLEPARNKYSRAAKIKIGMNLQCNQKCVGGKGRQLQMQNQFMHVVTTTASQSSVDKHLILQIICEIISADDCRELIFVGPQPFKGANF